MLIGHTETRMRYNIPHSNPDWFGISGISKSSWGKILRAKKLPINSLRSGVYVLNYYQQNKCKGNLLCAMAKYKGAISDDKIAMSRKFVNAYNEILTLEKQRDPEAFGIKPSKPIKQVKPIKQKVRKKK